MIVQSRKKKSVRGRYRLAFTCCFFARLAKRAVLPAYVWFLTIAFSLAAPSTKIDAVLAGCESGYAPFCYANPDGLPAGFAVELLDAVLRVMDLQPEYHVAAWPILKADLAEGRIQVLPLVGRTPEREAMYDFTFPYLTLHGVIVVRKDEFSIQIPADLKGRRVAVLRGDNAEEYLRRADLGAEIIPLNSFRLALKQLDEGQHDAVVIQQVVATQLIHQNGLNNLKVIAPPIRAFKQSFSLAVRKGDHALLAKLNEGLAYVMADGTFRSLSAKWLSEIQETNLSERPLFIGGDADFPPYQFIGEDGQPAGFYVDLTRAVARHLDMDVVFLPGNWKAVRAGLERGDIDVLQSMFFSEARSRTYYFSTPHTVVPYVIATRHGTRTPGALSELSGMRVAVVAGDIMHDAMVGLGNETNLVVVDLQETALEQLSGGEVDYALVAKVPAYYWIKKHGWKNIQIPDHAVLMPEACFAVLPENRALGELFSTGLSILKETGAYRDIQAQWLSPYESNGMSLKRVFITVAWAVVPLCILLVLTLLWSRSLRHQVVLRTAELAREVNGHREAKLRVTDTLNQAQHLLQETDLARSTLQSVVEDQKMTAEKLRSSEERFRNLYDSMSEGVAIHRIVYENQKAMGYVVESVNPAFERLLGKKAEEIIGKKGSDVYADELQLDLSVCAHVAETACPAKFELEAQKSGRTFSISLLSPVRGNFAVFIEDVSERKQAEREHKRLMAVIEQTGEVIVITDLNGIVQYVNPAFEKIRGYTSEEVVGRTLGGFKSGEQDTRFYAELWGTLRAGRVWTGRLTNRRKGGKLYTEDATISPVSDQSGRIISFVMASRDVTEELRMSEQLQQAQRLESIGRLAGGVAHDFNNMLGVILGNAELAMDRVVADDPIAGELSEICRAAERSAALTRQLLAFARQESGLPQIMDLNEAVSATLNMLRRLIGEGIELIWHPAAGDALVKSAPTQVDQILTNLAVNASDASDGVGEITIETRFVELDEYFCTTHPELEPGPYVLLVFSDAGCGMDAKTMTKIFEPFFTTKGLGKGTGLGLATVYGIVKQSGGSIAVFSEIDRGTTFEIYLPRVDPASPEPEGREVGR